MNEDQQEFVNEMIVVLGNVTERLHNAETTNATWEQLMFLNRQMSEWIDEVKDWGWVYE